MIPPDEASTLPGPRRREHPRAVTPPDGPSPWSVELGPELAEEPYPPDTVVGEKYVLGALIGRGGSSRVYRAFARHLDRPVALKIQNTDGNPSERARWLRESRLLATIKHPSVVQVYEVGELPDGELAIALELVTGPTLRAVLAERGPFSLGSAIDVVAQLLSAVRAVHEHQIVHRDIKPTNVVIVEDRRGARIKLIDFGAAKPLGEGEAVITRPSDVVGTPGYLAPEQIAPGSRIDARTDLFAVGIVLFELITGTRPFGQRDADIIASLSLGPPQPLLELRSRLSRPLYDLLASLLSTEPAGRPDHARAALASLLGVPEADEVRAPLTTPPPPSRKAVLVVSASPTRRATWCRMVESVGGSAMPVAQVEAALLLAEESEAPITVLFDRSAPTKGRDGEVAWEAFSKLAALPESRVRLVAQVLREPGPKEARGRVRSLVMPVTEDELARLMR